MTLSDLYLFCFAFGFFFSLVAVVTGHVNLSFGDGQADVGDLSHMGGDAPDSSSVSAAHHVSPLNMGTIAAFLAWFGGTGYLITRFYRLWFVSTLAIALTTGIGGGYLVYLFLAKVLMRTREDMDPADYDMVGVLGTVSGAIRPGGTGEILYSRDGARRAAAARSDDGVAIANGEEVVVTRYEDGIAFVRRWEDLAAN